MLSVDTARVVDNYTVETGQRLEHKERSKLSPLKTILEDSKKYLHVKTNTNITIVLTQINTKIEKLLSVHLIYHSIWPTNALDTVLKRAHILSESCFQHM